MATNLFNAHSPKLLDHSIDRVEGVSRKNTDQTVVKSSISNCNKSSFFIALCHTPSTTWICIPYELREGHFKTWTTTLECTKDNFHNIKYNINLPKGQFSQHQFQHQLEPVRTHPTLIESNSWNKCVLMCFVIFLPLGGTTQISVVCRQKRRFDVFTEVAKLAVGKIRRVWSGKKTPFQNL